MNPYSNGGPTAYEQAYNNVENNMFIENSDENLEDLENAKLFERSRIKALADERESVQKKTFCKWVNSHLARVGCKIQDLYVDLRDGKMLIKLLEVLSGERLPNPTKGKMRIHCLENVDKSLTFLNEQRVHLENMGAHDIVDGNPRLTLGLIWTIILRFQIQDITIESTDTTGEVKSAKDALLLWCQMKTAGYPNVNVRNFTTSWRDGLAFNALIHKHRPDLIEYNKLQRANPVNNLNNAFNVAEDRLGLVKLLDVEDVNVEYPDDKSIITYVVTYYHYFSRMKAESVQGRRVGKVLNQCCEYDAMIADYDSLTTDLLEWIQRTMITLNDRQFANSLNGVQQQLAAFNSYRNVEKPPKFTDKGNLEILLFTIQSKMRANNQKPYTPEDGKKLADINHAWEQLERAEHERELALREELIRQEKLEQLAARFDRKAGMRESWLNENQRLVSQDNFGYDLAAVEAATRKHEAIETDINAYEERVLAVVSVASELEQENYHDIERINARKDNVVRLWDYLKELLNARRRRLQVTLQLQKTFQEMIYLLDWVDEIKARLLSDDYGKHLMGVEDLMQKHSLLESDIGVVGSRVCAINGQAQRFVDGRFPDLEDYVPCDPTIVLDRMRNLEAAYEELLELSKLRWSRLGESLKLWQFYWDMADEETWIKEKEQLMSSPDLGHDLTSVQLLLTKHKATEEELASHEIHQQSVLAVGDDLVKANNIGSDKIQRRSDEIVDQWRNLKELANYRKNCLQQSLDYFQFFVDADDVDTWMLDTLRLVSSEDVGHDEASVQSLVKKHKNINEELVNYQKVINDLTQQANNLSDQYRDSTEVSGRLGSITRRYAELRELAELRKQRLLDALALCKLLNEADGVEQWITEKEKLLHTMVATEDLEEVEILKARFDTFDQEVKANADKVEVVNQLSRQLLDNQHPNADEVVRREQRLNSKWADLRHIADDKKATLDLAHDLNQFHGDCQETRTWIGDKAKLIESTDELGNDLAGVTTLQRRLSGLERDLAAIQDKLDHLTEEANRLSQDKPQEAAVIRGKINDLTNDWLNLKDMLKQRDNRLGVESELQKFLQDLDHFQQWLTRTQTEIASEDYPNTVAEADALIVKHNLVKEEIDQYAPDYSKMKDYGAKVVQGKDDSEHMFLREKLKALDDDWNSMQRMWESKLGRLNQRKDFQAFLRDVKQVEIMLSQQDNFLANDEKPHSLEHGERLLKDHTEFQTRLDANDVKLNAVCDYGQQLIQGGNYASDKIKPKIDSCKERQDRNRRRANEQLAHIKDYLALQQFMQDCDELADWVGDKMISAQDETYRDAKNIHSKWLRHQAVESEVKSNKERLDALINEGEQIINEKPEMASVVEPKLADLQQQWKTLDETLAEKGQRLFDSNRPVLYEQSCDDVEGWINEIESQIISEDVGRDLITVNLLVQKQNILESQMKVKQQQVDSLEAQSTVLQELEPDKQEEILAKKTAVEARFAKMMEPLIARRAKLDEAKKIHQFLRDVQDEKMWIDEKMLLAMSPNYGNSLLTVQMLEKKNKSLLTEVDNHEPRIKQVIDLGLSLIEAGHPQSAECQGHIAELNKKWEELMNAIDDRKYRLELSHAAQQYLMDASEAESWMSEQELYMMSAEKAKDEQGANNSLKKHANMATAIDDYESTIRQLSDTARQFIESNHPDSQAIALKQARVDKQYAGLKELKGERREKLGEVLKLYKLFREIDDLEQWLAEREVVAGSHELGQDFEHVTMLRDRFREFAEETQCMGQERVAAVNEICDVLIQAGHSDAATIAEWKDGINETWTDLLELIDTRTQALAASWLLYKFFNDCQETLARINEKQNILPEDLGKDAQTTAALQRRLTNFEHDLINLGVQVQEIQEDAARLIVCYSGEKARDIQRNEMDVVNAWRNLQLRLDQRKRHLEDSNDLYRFFAMVRDLLNWMNDMTRQMTSSEKPRDISGVELLMNNHRSLKAEIDARDENFTICVNLGKELLARRHPRTMEIRDKLVQLGNQRGHMMDQWEERWEYLHLILEVYQFARDATVAEAWLIAHEPYVNSQDFGATLDAVETLMKKHEAFERSAATQEERFIALEKLTALELKDRQRKQQEEYKRQHPGSIVPQKQSYADKYIAEFLPPIEPPQREKEEKAAEQARAAVGMEEQRLEAKKDITSQSGGVRTVKVELPIKSLGRVVVVKNTMPSVISSPVTPSSGRSPSSGSAAVTEVVVIEGSLVRKHEWETQAKKATNRSWDKVYVVLGNRALAFYKDQKQSKTEPRAYFHHEAPLNLEGITVAAATDYSKRPHVFRTKFTTGSEFLFQCKDEEEMVSWINAIRSSSGASAVDVSSPGKYQTLPSSLEGKRDEPKRRSFLTLGRKSKERD